MNSRVSHYQEMIAEQLWEYIISSEDKTAICEILQIAIDLYNEPKQRWVTTPIYAYSRQRSEELSQLLNSLKKAETHQAFVVDFINIFQTGGWTNTSANVDIIRGLMVMLYGMEEDNQHYLTEHAIQDLGEKLLHRVKEPVTAKDQASMANANTVFSDKKRDELKTEIKTLRQIDFEGKRTNLLNFHLLKKPDDKPEPAFPSQKLDVKYGNSVNLVADLLLGKLGKKPTTDKFIETPIDTTEARKNIANFFNAKFTSKSSTVQEGVYKRIT